MIKRMELCVKFYDDGEPSDKLEAKIEHAKEESDGR